MGNIRAKVPSNDAVPGGVVLLVELALDEGGNILLDIVFLHRLGGAVDSVLLHLLGHVGVLDDCFAVGHCEGNHGRVRAPKSYFESLYFFAKLRLNTRDEAVGAVAAA